MKIVDENGNVKFVAMKSKEGQEELVRRGRQIEASSEQIQENEVEQQQQKKVTVKKQVKKNK